MHYSEFIRYDEVGLIVAAGVMQKEHIEAERKAGGLILAVKPLPPLDGSVIVRDGALAPAKPSADGA